MGSLESDTTERLHFHFSLSCIGEGNGNPLQCSCLENPRDGGAWWAAVYGVAQSRTGLKRLSSILSKVHASVFMNMEPSLPLPLVEQNVNARVWADGKSVGQAQNAIPVVVKLKDPHVFPHKQQYPLKPEVKEGLKPIIKNLKEQGLLVPCNSQ